MEEIMGLLIIFGSVFGCVFVVSYFTAQGSARRLEALTKIVERDGEVPPDLVARLSAASGPTSDLRKGLVWIAIGVPLTWAMVMNAGWRESVFGAIPIFIGVAYLIVMKFGHGERR